MMIKQTRLVIVTQMITVAIRLAHIAVAVVVLVVTVVQELQILVIRKVIHIVIIMYPAMQNFVTVPMIMTFVTTNSAPTK